VSNSIAKEPPRTANASSAGGGAGCLFGTGSNGWLRRRSGGAPQRHRRLLLQNHVRQCPKGGGTADLPPQRAWRGRHQRQSENALFGCIRVHPTIADVDPIRSDEHHAAARTARGKCFIGRAVHDHTQSATLRSCCPDSAERHLGSAVLLQAYQWIAGSRMKRRKCLDYLHDPLKLDRCHSITKGLNPAKAIGLITLPMECPRLDIQGHAHMTLLPRNEAEQCNLSPCSENATLHAAEAESARGDIDVHRHVSSIDERNPRP
jgi:hypothetical protein